MVGARVLWVDNNPHGNAAARKAMEELGISVTTALSTTEAELFLDPGRNDLVISNMKRPDEENPGDMLRDASIATA